MKTRTIFPLWSVAAMFLAACSSSPSMEPPSDPIYLDLDDFELVSQDVLIGQEGIDYERAWIERDLERMLAEDPDHPGVEQIRRALAELDREQRWLDWRVAHGFERRDGSYIPHTEEEFWRAVIESPEMLELTDDQLKAAKAHYLSILARDTVARDTTVAASGGDIVCTTDAGLSSGAGGDLFYDAYDNLLRFNTVATTQTTSYLQGFGMTGTPQRHRFTGLAEPDAVSSSGNLTTYIMTSWQQRICVRTMRTPQNFVYTGAQPGAQYCAGGPYIGGEFGKAEKWSQQYTWDFSTWINYDHQPVAIGEDCVTVPGDGGGGCEEDDCPEPPNNEGCEWVSGPGYGFWFCVSG